MDRILTAAEPVDATAMDPVHARELFLLEWDITEELTTVVPQAGPLEPPTHPIY